MGGALGAAFLRFNNYIILGMRNLVVLLCCLGGLLLTSRTAQAFVMIGPMDVSEVASGGVDFNYTDDLGGPKDLKRFFRWNIPVLTYSFDASFMQYFGLEGRVAVKEAFEAINDFFSNSDYSGVSSLDLVKHGFRSNFNTAWINQTAENMQILDVKSLTLGLIVNQLGLGNPHRYAFGINRMATNTVGTQINFNVRLRNYDPVTYKPTPEINGVTYSYRLIHDATPSAGVIQLPSFADMEEFTTDTSGNKWSAVSAIPDAFYGNSAIFWTETPSLFGFGVYYDHLNAIGGQIQPRHALTYDDAGGLKFLYKTNNFVYEGLDPNVALILPANFLPTFAIPVFPNGSARIYPDPTGTSGAYIPRRNSGFIPGLPITSVLPAQAPPSLIDVAMRGGIDKIQFVEQPFDSFLGITFTATSHVWTDTFVSTNGQSVGNLNNTMPGSSAYIGIPTLKFFTQQIGRGVFQPDIIFVADELGVSPDGVPIGWNRTDNTLWIDNSTNNMGPVTLLTTNLGPGVILGPLQYTYTKITEGFEVIWSGEASVVGNMSTYSMWGHIKGPGKDDIVVFPNDANITILENVLAPVVLPPEITMVSDDGGKTEITTQSYTRTEETLTLIGSRLSSVTAIEIMDGDKVLQTLWQGVQQFIKSDQRIDIPPGKLDWKVEGTSRQVRVWNTVGVSDKSAKDFNIYTGKPVVSGVVPDNLSTINPNPDARSVYDRGEQTLLVRGYGFKSLQTRSEDGNYTLSHIRIEDFNDNKLVFPTGGSSSQEVVWELDDEEPDRIARLQVGQITAAADGFNRRIRVGRGTSETAFSDRPATTTDKTGVIYLVTAAPTVASLQSIDLNGTKSDINATDGIALRRDRAVEIRGTGLNAITEIRITRLDKNGSIYIPITIADNPNSPRYEGNPLYANPGIPANETPNAGVMIDDNGSLIQISKSVFTGLMDRAGELPMHIADGHTNDELCILELKHVVKNYKSSSDSISFNVNVQPEIQALITGSGPPPNGSGVNLVPNKLTQDVDTKFSHQIRLTGTGLKAVSELRVTDINGTDLSSSSVNLTLPQDGVTVSDSEILIDTKKVIFNNATAADSTNLNDWRRIKAISSRETKTSKQEQVQMFWVGYSPTFASISGGVTDTEVDFRRDAESITFTGTQLALTTRIEVTDQNGNPINNALALIRNSNYTWTGQGVSSSSATGFTIDANATPWIGNEHLIDSSTYLTDLNGTRKIKVTTPFGSATSTAAYGFTVSATPEFLPLGSTADTAAQTFAGSHDFNGTDFNSTYYTTTGGLNPNGPSLVVNGKNFRGLKRIYLADWNATGSDADYNATLASSVAIDPTSPPAGIVVNGTGTQISFTQQSLQDINATWLTDTSTKRALIFQSAGDQNASTPAINVSK